MDALAKRKFKPGNKKQNEVAKTYQNLNDNLYERTKGLLESIDTALLNKKSNQVTKSLNGPRKSVSPRPGAEMWDDPYLIDKQMKLSELQKQIVMQ